VLGRRAVVDIDGGVSERRGVGTVQKEVAPVPEGGHSWLALRRPLVVGDVAFQVLKAQRLDSLGEVPAPWRPSMET
jgi:hypothetical protein